MAKRAKTKTPAPLEKGGGKTGSKKPASTKTAPAKTAAEFFVSDNPDACRAGVKKWNRLTHEERAAISLAGVPLAGCDLTGINLSGCEAPKGVSFAGAILAEARVTGTFNKVSFAGAVLTGARLTESAFDETDFSQAKLDGADLTASHFRKASFAGADLTRANLTNISLLGADLTGAMLTDAIFSGGWFNKDTRWPPGFLPPGDMAWHGVGTDPRLSGKGKKAVAHDINGLLARLHKVIDAKRMKRTIDLLKKEKHQLFYEIEPTMVRGIVRSQTEEDRYYSCVLTEDGTYSCASPDVVKCMGLSDEPCKHLLTLIIGLARAGLLDAATADRWMVAAQSKGPRWNKTVQNHISDSLLKYKGVQAGEVDWRPMETIPEDFYAM